MRIWGRVYDLDAQGRALETYEWVPVTTDPDGSNDYVYITNLIQVLKLNRQESPFFANYGIPAQLSVITQVFPDIYVFETQRQFAAFFASLIITRLQAPDPTYRVDVTTHQGVKMAFEIPV